MTPEDLAARLIDDPDRMQKYREAIAMLRGLGFETVMRRLGEPTDDIPVSDPRHIELSAINQIEKRGWHRALDLVFDFDQIVTTAQAAPGADLGDYGAREAIQKMGYSTEEIE